MTGGFYDHRRSKLKFMNIIMQNTKSINLKEEELEKVRSMLQDILFLVLYCFLLNNALYYPFSGIVLLLDGCYMHL